jgi:hypothetical protein
MGKKAIGICILVYSLILLVFTIYSYSQIDLNLTLSSNPLYQHFQQMMIQLGYFNRPLSTSIFLSLVFSLFLFYFLFLWLVRRGIIGNKEVYCLIILSVAILFFSYPAFSHDFFNYMFDARIVTRYGLSPYQYRALDFPADAWIRFMHWTHRYYPYGPGWILLTLPLSWLGFSKFTLTLLNFKLLFSGFYTGSVYLINKILAKISPRERLLGVVFFSLNPLVLIEGIVSPHNDMAMLFFLILSLYFLILSRGKQALFTLIISASIKFLTIVFLPVILFWKNDKWQKMVFSSVLIFFLSSVVLIWQHEPYPWYFLILVGLVSLVSENRFLKRLTIGICLGTLLRYAPFLYFGDYSGVVSTAQFWLTSVPILLALLSLKVI